MIKAIPLTLPASPETLARLNAGDVVSISGVVLTARDAAHKRFVECIEGETPLPVSLENAAIYYCGPTPARRREIIGSCGPTTSARMDDYTPAVLSSGVRVMIGKGKRSAEVVSAIKRFGGVYLVTVGGAAALAKQCVRSCRTLAYADLGCEAVYELIVENMQAAVAIDARGNSIFKDCPKGR